MYLFDRFGAMDEMIAHTHTPADELDCFCGRESDEDANLSNVADSVTESIEDILVLKEQLEDLLYVDHEGVCVCVQFLCMTVLRYGGNGLCHVLV